MSNNNDQVNESMSPLMTNDLFVLQTPITKHTLDGDDRPQKPSVLRTPPVTVLTVKVICTKIIKGLKNTIHRVFKMAVFIFRGTKSVCVIATVALNMYGASSCWDGVTLGAQKSCCVLIGHQRFKGAIWG